MSSADLQGRLEEVRERISSALERGGRAGAEVTIVAVTKTYPADVIRAARAAGLQHVGENRVQELIEKVEEIGRDAATWHLIGHLQRNKARRAVPAFDLLHSLDSIRLARELSGTGIEAGQPVRVLIQVNASGEASKSGFTPEGFMDAAREICDMPGLRVEGLMTMAPLTEDETTLRRTFAATRRLAEQARGQIPGFNGDQLSMGMSNDFEIAVEEGSTLVRLGTVLFGARST